MNNIENLRKHMTTQQSAAAEHRLRQLEAEKKLENSAKDRVLREKLIISLAITGSLLSIIGFSLLALAFFL